MAAACDLSPDDCKMFGSVLIRSKTLRSLNLEVSNLGQGISLLCKSLYQVDCILEHFILAQCSLSEQCWDCLSEVLRWNKTLSHLDISSSDLKDKGQKVLCRILTFPVYWCHKV